MDITMPVQDGLEAARLLKASDVTRDLKSIAYTGKPDIHGGAATLFVGVLPQPAALQTMVASIQRFLENKASSIGDPCAEDGLPFSARRPPAVQKRQM